MAWDRDAFVIGVDQEVRDGMARDVAVLTEHLVAADVLGVFEGEFPVVGLVERDVRGGFGGIHEKRGREGMEEGCVCGYSVAQQREEKKPKEKAGEDRRK